MTRRRVRQARLAVGGMKEYIARMEEDGRNPRGVNAKAHDQLHAPKTIIYTSTMTLNTIIGPKLLFPKGGEITSLRCSVAGVGTAIFKMDYLIDGLSVFDSGEYLQIPIGSTVSKTKMLKRPTFNEDSYHQVQINTIGACTGPMITTIEYMEEW